MLERANIVIIGGGVVGLAIAAELSKDNEGVFVFEKNKRLGQEVSSHNSGVVHSGIHYPKNSLKESSSPGRGILQFQFPMRQKWPWISSRQKLQLDTFQ